MSAAATQPPAVQRSSHPLTTAAWPAGAQLAAAASSGAEAAAMLGVMFDARSVVAAPLTRAAVLVVTEWIVDIHPGAAAHLRPAAGALQLPFAAVVAAAAVATAWQGSSAA